VTFFIQGLNNHELMATERLFKEPIGSEIHAISPRLSIKEKEQHLDKRNMGQPQRRRAAARAYQVIDQLPKTETILFAEQIMTSSVVTLSLQSQISNALEILRMNPFRHIPVVTDGNRLAGIISDRDIMHYLGGISEDYQSRVSLGADDRVERLMQPRVLTASRDTDVRYIARLFVEQRVGAMPIVTDGKLSGIVTRSDILGAVMRHFVLELWA